MFLVYYEVIQLLVNILNTMVFRNGILLLIVRIYLIDLLPRIETGLIFFS